MGRSNVVLHVQHVQHVHVHVAGSRDKPLRKGVLLCDTYIPHRRLPLDHSRERPHKPLQVYESQNDLATSSTVAIENILRFLSHPSSSQTHTQGASVYPSIPNNCAVHNHGTWDGARNLLRAGSPWTTLSWHRWPRQISLGLE